MICFNPSNPKWVLPYLFSWDFPDYKPSFFGYPHLSKLPSIYIPIPNVYFIYSDIHHRSKWWYVQHVPSFFVCLPEGTPSNPKFSISFNSCWPPSDRCLTQVPGSHGRDEVRHSAATWRPTVKINRWKVGVRWHFGDFFWGSWCLMMVYGWWLSLNLAFSLDFLGFLWFMNLACVCTWAYGWWSDGLSKVFLLVVATQRQHR